MNGFSIAFQAPSDLSPRTVDPVDDVDDNVISLLACICEELQSEPGVRFEIGGFGENPWPTDIGTDFLLVLEQLPELIAALSQGREGNLDLYEQGMQRMLRFAPADEVIKITCQSLMAWQPDPDTVTIRAPLVLAMLTTVLERFLVVVHQAFPSIANHEWIVEWHRPVSSSTRA